MDEPHTVYPEAEFEAVLRHLVDQAVDGRSGITVVPKFGLDIAIFSRADSGMNATFIEAKSFGGQRQGGVGFGNGRGEGPQVNILLCSTSEIGSFDRSVRWAFADQTRPFGMPRYALLNCTDAGAATMGGVALGKQNNFRLSAIEPHFVGWRAFCEALNAFLTERLRLNGRQDRPAV